MKAIVTAWAYLYAAPVLVVVAIVLWRRSALILSSRAKRSIGTLRALALILLCCALADVKILDDAAQQHGGKAVVLLDVSESIAGGEVERAIGQIQQFVEGPLRQVDVPCDVFLFDESAKQVPADLSRGAFDDTRRELAETTGATDIPTALQRALAAIPEGTAGHVVVVSDGRSTGGSIDGVLATARLRGIRISTMPLQAREPDGLLVDGFKVPEKVFILEKFPVEALIRSQQAGQVRVRLFRDGDPLTNEVLEVKRGVTRWDYQAREETVGRHRYSFHVEKVSVPDTYEQNNFQVAAVWAETVPRILVVTNEQQDLAPFTKSLSDAGIKHKMILERDFPHGMSGLLQYSAVLSNDVAADELRPTQLDLIKTYVQDYGGGFMMLGGKKSFGMGGYYDTPVEEVLPVNMSPQSYSASFGMILLRDSSGSMDGFPIQWVKRAAKQIIWLMRGRFLGIYYFNTLPRVAVRLQRIGQNRVLVEQDIDSIRASGGTAFSTALVQACKDLDMGGFAHKHIILLSDGNPSDEEVVKRLYKSIDKADIKVSTIGIGKNVNNHVLREMAKECKGRFYESQEVHRIPEIFEEEVKRIVGPPYVEEPFNPVPEPSSPLVAGYTSQSLPILQGYVGTTIKERAQLDMASPRNDVILAHWRFGLGKTAAFTSGVGQQGWGSQWAVWPDLSKFWGRVVKSILRIHPADFELNINVRERQANLTVDGVDIKGEYINGANLDVRVEDPDGVAIGPLQLRQVAEGRYQGSFSLGKKGFYDVAVRRGNVGDTVPETVCNGIVALGFSQEYRFEPTDRAFLASLAATTAGGRMVESLDRLGADIVEQGQAVDVSKAWDLWPLFLLLALAVFVAEVTIRRMNFFAEEPSTAAGEDGSHTQATSYKRIADQYLQIANEFDAKGDEKQAQDYYLKARSFYLKAKQTDQAAHMWERYRFLDRKRAG